MFGYALAFNQPLAGWDVSKVDMRAMFEECPIVRKNMPMKKSK